MEISTISVGRMNNGAHYLYNVDFYSRIDADTAVKGKLTEVLPAYKQAIDNEDIALKISQKSLNSDKIDEYDRQPVSYTHLYDNSSSTRIASVEKATALVIQGTYTYTASNGQTVTSENAYWTVYINNNETASNVTNDSGYTNLSHFGVLRNVCLLYTSTRKTRWELWSLR